MRLFFLTVFVPFFCFNQSNFKGLLPEKVPYNKDLLIEKKEGRSISLFLEEEYHVMNQQTVACFNLTQLFINKPDSICILSVFDGHDSKFFSMLLASWKNGKSQEIVVSVEKSSLKIKEHIWLIDSFNSTLEEDNCNIYFESGGNFYIEFINTREDSEPIKKYYSFNNETGFFELSD